MKRGPPANKINLGPPPRWLKCPRHGQVIAGKFVPLKTPLSSSYDEEIPEQYRFYVPMVFGVFRHSKIGLWIDLTNTDRFYSSEEVEACGAKYYKMVCKGHGECPSEEKTRLFTHVCKVFIRDNPDKLIAVHCTHGFNRTGFLIAAYLIEEKSWSAEAAVQAFSNSRPPGMYKQDYLAELFRRYDNPSDAPLAPALPGWCDEFDPLLNDQEAESSTSSRQDSTKSASYCVEGVPSAVLVTDRNKISEVHAKCKKLCQSNKSGFLGSQPVSMDIDNISLLEQKYYEVTWKADGVRYMMLIMREKEAYMIDRDNKVYKVPNMIFPYRKNLQEHLYDTLLDGELIFDEINGSKCAQYLIYDIVWFREDFVGGCDFGTRKLCIEKEVIGPRKEAVKANMIDSSKEPFNIRAKSFWDITQVAKILSPAFTVEGAHEIDGLIFQPVPDAYHIGRCFSVLKWKPHHMNSIDFKLKISRVHKEGMLPEYVGDLFVLRLDRPFDRIKVTKDLKQYDNKIIECCLEKGAWKFMRERRDKSFPNAFETAKGVMKSISNPITKEVLINFVQNRAKKPKKRVLPPSLTAADTNEQNGVMPPPPLIFPAVKIAKNSD